MNIDKCNLADINAKFCDINIGSCKKSEIVCQHCLSVNIGESDALTFNAAHSDITARKLSNASFVVRHSTLNINEAKDDIKLLACQHSQVNVGLFDKIMSVESCSHSEIDATVSNANSFSGFNLDGSFSTVILRLPVGTKSGYELDNTYGSIEIDKRLDAVQSMTEEKRFYKALSGHLGKSSKTSAKIQMSNKHGSISIKAK